MVNQTASLSDRFAVRPVLPVRPLRCQNGFGKRGGILGGFVVMFVATIVIFVILLGLVIFSVFVREFDNADSDVIIPDLAEMGIGDVFNYMAGNRNFVQAKFLIENGMGLDEALEEEGYEK